MVQKQTIQVIAADGISDISDMKQVSEAMNGFDRQPLAHHLWTAIPNPQQVAFAIAYHGTDILLKYFIGNDQVRAYHTQINGEVWHDSCVEFFISFDDSSCYYNIELNCIGTARVGYGRTATDRILLDNAVVNQIDYLTELRSEKGKNCDWEITLRIPIQLFVYHEKELLAGKQYRANFFKCGDSTPHPHFIAWTEIDSETPNFHLPEYFGELKFE